MKSISFDVPRAGCGRVGTSLSRLLRGRRLAWRGRGWRPKTCRSTPGGVWGGWGDSPVPGAGPGTDAGAPAAAASRGRACGGGARSSALRGCQASVGRIPAWERRASRCRHRAARPSAWERSGPGVGGLLPPTPPILGQLLLPLRGSCSTASATASSPASLPGSSPSSACSSAAARHERTPSNREKVYHVYL